MDIPPVGIGSWDAPAVVVTVAIAFWRALVKGLLVFGPEHQRCMRRLQKLEDAADAQLAAYQELERAKRENPL